MNDMEQWEELNIPTHPIEGGRWVMTVAEIRHNATGQVRECEHGAILMDGEHDPENWIWSGGNNGCDCNRHILFTGGDYLGPCGEGLYSVRVRNKSTGRVFYSEF